LEGKNILQVTDLKELTRIDGSQIEWRLRVFPMKRSLHTQVVSLNDVRQDASLWPKQQRRIDILVVDDEPTIADTLAMILSKTGYRVRVAYDGSSALARAQEGRPRLVITDVVMPGMSGIELALALETLVPESKVMLFSGQAATVDLLAKARETGRDFAIVSKPIHPADMIRRVSEYVQPIEHESYAAAN
jgi:CheY-like chemotaxis protein